MAKKLPRGLTETLQGYRIQFSSRHTRPGEMYRERLPKGTTLSQAKEYLNKLREADRLGNLMWLEERQQEKELQRSLTVGEFAPLYMEHCSADNRAPTLKRKAKALQELARWFWDIRMEDITKANVSRFATERKAEGVSSRGVNLEMGQLAHLLSVAHDLDYLPHRPPKFKKLSEKDRRSARFLSREEAGIALDAASERGPMWRALFLFLLHTGARWGETRGLLWTDVDLEARRVRFRGQVSKGGRDRIIPLLPEVNEALEGLERLGEYVFMRVLRGRPVRVTVDGRLEGRFYPWADQEKGFDCSPHVLRHTFAAWQLRAGIGMEKVQKLMGHSTIKLIVDTYGHIVSDEHAEEIERIYRPAQKPILRVVGGKDASS